MTPQTSTAPSFVRLAFYGGLGGAANATLVYAAWPVAAANGAEFSPAIIPAGAVHGALLALAAAGGLTLLRPLSRPARAAAVPLLGWIAGWLSFIPLHLEILAMPITIAPSLPGKPAGLSMDDALKVLWPFESSLESLWIPFLNFGLVPVIVWVLGLWRQAPAFLVWIAAGVFGSLWWWISYEPWWLSALHGTIWGGLAGVAHTLAPRPARP